MFLQGAASRSFHDAGAFRLFSFRNLLLVMNTSGSSAIAVHMPSPCLKRGRSLSNDGGLYPSNTPSLIPAANVSTGPPNSTSTCGLPFSAMIRVNASPDEKRTKLTLMPVAFSNSSNIGRAQFSGQIEYALSVSAACADSGAVAAISSIDSTAGPRASQCRKRRTIIMVPPSIVGFVIRRCRSRRRALAYITVGHRRFALWRRNALSVEHHRDLRRRAELAVASPLLVDHPEDVPFVVRAAAHCRRCTQRVVLAEIRLGEAALHSLREVGVGSDALVEVRVELAHVVGAVEAEVAREILRPGEVDEVEIAGAVRAFEQCGPHQHVVGTGALRQVGLEHCRVQHVDELGSEALFERRACGVGHFLVDVEVAAAAGGQRHAQVADGLAGLALLGDGLPEAVDLRLDRRFQFVVHAIADADLRAFGRLGGERAGRGAAQRNGGGQAREANDG